jgi:rare lipoprotein A
VVTVKRRSLDQVWKFAAALFSPHLQTCSLPQQGMRECTMSQRKKMIMLAGLFASVAVCSPASAKSAEPADRAERQVQHGEASWYGPGFHGRRTASGERFDTNAMTAAHRSLPFGTRVRVVNKSNGQSVVVRINDRGPYARGRVIDLSRASAQALGISGIADVEVIQL